MLFFLRYIFRHNCFREGQIEGLQRLLSKKDSIILLPTGSGKSLIFQMASLIVVGKIFIVAPLVSLMGDQINNLYYQGIDCAKAIHHGSSVSEIETALNDPRVTMIYLSPERLQIKSFRDLIHTMLINNSVFSVTVDEAHCVSEWGHDFRTAYLNIGRTSREVFRRNGESPVIIALTGTASTAVLRDVQRELNIYDYGAVITPETFDRKELHFRIFRSTSKTKLHELTEIMNEYLPTQFHQSRSKFYLVSDDDTNGGIIFCPHVNGEYGVQSVCIRLKSDTVTRYYSGEAPKGYKGDWTSEMRKVSSDFKSNKVGLLIATKAYGMGIDKPNVRYTIHYGIPSSIESFYQEAGRAGRDGKTAVCCIILSDENQKINDRLLDPRTPLESVTETIKSLNIGEGDDISRALYFHINSFRGIQFESERVEELCLKLFEHDELCERVVVISCATDDADNSLGNVQKALQRLMVLGVVSDYTVEYSAKEVNVITGNKTRKSISQHFANYVRGYNEGRVASELAKLNNAFDAIPQNSSGYNAQCARAAAEVLIEFIYDTIEKGRRRGLREMLRIAEAAIDTPNQDREIRSRIVRYFESTYSIEINLVIESLDLGFDVIPMILDGEENEVGEKIGGVRSANEASGLRGQVSRYLESTPDHPGLLSLRALAELYCKNYDTDAIESDFSAFISFALERYSCTKSSLMDFLVYFLRKVFERDSAISNILFRKAASIIGEDDLCARFIDEDSLSEEQKCIPAIIYFSKKAYLIIERITILKGVSQ